MNLLAHKHRQTESQVAYFEFQSLKWQNALRH